MDQIYFLFFYNTYTIRELHQLLPDKLPTRIHGHRILYYLPPLHVQDEEHIVTLSHNRIYRKKITCIQTLQMILDELNVKSVEVKSFKEIEELDGQENYIVVAEGNVNSAIYTELTPELEAEGMAREIVHRLQTMRRSADFDIADHIETYYEADEYVCGVMTADMTAGYIKQETLSRQLTEGLPGEVDYRETFKLSGHEVLLGVKKVD